MSIEFAQEKIAPGATNTQGEKGNTSIDTLPEKVENVKLPVDRIKRWYSESKNKDRAIKDMCDVYHCSPDEIYNIIGIQLPDDADPRLTWSKPRVEKLIELYREGKNYDEIADVLHVTVPSVKAKTYKLQANGILGKRKASKKPSIDLLCSQDADVVAQIFQDPGFTLTALEGTITRQGHTYSVQVNETT